MTEVTRILASIEQESFGLAMDAAGNVYLTGETQSNAQLALPVIADLAQIGVANEAICAVDTLIYGCSGGHQPACGVP